MNFVTVYVRHSLCSPLFTLRLRGISAQRAISLEDKMAEPQVVCNSLAPKRRCSSHTFRYGYLVTT